MYVNMYEKRLKYARKYVKKIRHLFVNNGLLNSISTNLCCMRMSDVA